MKRTLEPDIVDQAHAINSHRAEPHAVAVLDVIDLESAHLQICRRSRGVAPLSADPFAGLAAPSAAGPTTPAAASFASLGGAPPSRKSDLLVGLNSAPPASADPFAGIDLGAKTAPAAKPPADTARHLPGLEQLLARQAAGLAHGAAEPCEERRPLEAAEIVRGQPVGGRARKNGRRRDPLRHGPS